VAGSCERGNEHSGSIKGEKFSDLPVTELLKFPAQLSKYYEGRLKSSWTGGRALLLRTRRR
jgi:hypothetical protein